MSSPLFKKVGDVDGYNFVPGWNLSWSFLFTQITKLMRVLEDAELFVLYQLLSFVAPPPHPTC